MKFALVNGQRQEARPNLSGKCLTCDHPMVAKCGEVKIWHWAHQGSRICDPWWENETEWHRSWKGQFPVNWQEVVHQAANGEKHIADVKTDGGWVIEFQHSYLKPDERRSRDDFYAKLVWVVDGVRRKKDEGQFVNAWNEGGRVGTNAVVRRVSFLDECRLLQEWADSHAPVFFDFGDGQVLWWLLRPGVSAYLAKFSRSAFIEILRGGTTQVAHHYFDELVKDISKLVADYESLRTQALKRAALQPLQGFQRYLARGGKLRRRF